MRIQRLETTLHRYIDFETKLNKLMSGICSNICKCCNSICCEVKYCNETQYSYWLSTVIHHSKAFFVFDTYNGWLSSKGCIIPYGKPPVCYEYYCSSIKTYYPPDAYQYLKLLGNLINRIGHRALGDRHLITLTSEQIYTKLNLEKILDRIEIAQTTLAECSQYLYALKADNPLTTPEISVCSHDKDSRYI